VVPFVVDVVRYQVFLIPRESFPPHTILVILTIPEDRPRGRATLPIFSLQARQGSLYNDEYLLLWG
jgi:hypothetical protein